MTADQLTLSLDRSATRPSPEPSCGTTTTGASRSTSATVPSSWYPETLAPSTGLILEGSATSPSAGAERRCRWCSELLSTTRGDFCGKKCRQTAFRARRRRATPPIANPAPLRFAYADPPYPGKARKYYADQPTYRGEVDHEALVASLKASGYAGWALSTSRDALRWVLPLCPEDAFVAPWVKPIGANTRTLGPHNTWEPVIVVPGRRLRNTHGLRDWLSAQPARFGGSLPGRKPIAFCAWLFDLLGMLPGDELVDLFPGTGVVGRAWAELSRTPSAAQAPAPTTRPVARSSSPRGLSDGSAAAGDAAGGSP